MRRVLVIGSGGAGKSTLAVRLGAKVGLPVFHLDAHYWRPGWIETPKEEWQRFVEQLVGHDAWIMDGNYSGTLDLRIVACDTVVFLDLPRLTCVARVLRRRLRFHRRSRPDMALGCPERLNWEFLRWIWTYPARRRPQILARLAPLERQKSIVTLRSTREVEAFLRGLPAGRGEPSA